MLVLLIIINSYLLLLCSLHSTVEFRKLQSPKAAVLKSPNFQGRSQKAISDMIKTLEKGLTQVIQVVQRSRKRIPRNTTKRKKYFA